MKIQGLRNAILFQPEEKNQAPNPTEGFGEMMSGMIKDVNANQIHSNEMLTDYLQGGDVELHEVMIASQKARTSLDLLMELRNKSLDMYRELTRMQ